MRRKIVRLVGSLFRRKRERESNKRHRERERERGQSFFRMWRQKKTTRNCCSLLRYKKERKRLRHAKDHETSPMDDALARDDGNARAPTTTTRSDHHPAREKPKNRFVKKKKEVVRPPLIIVLSHFSFFALGTFSKTKRTHFPDTSKKKRRTYPIRARRGSHGRRERRHRPGGQSGGFLHPALRRVSF